MSIEQLTINTIRTLSMDAVQKANSGHPGTPMALAPLTYLLWNEFLRYDPQQPCWPGRDRFVLSCGHASMLLYSILHLAGVQNEGEDGPAISLEDIKSFRQLGSPCAGHPELGDAAGIEMTTGPLGQGVGTSVGMAMAARWMSARYGRPGHDLLGYNVYVLCSDGDLMEGIGCEAASLAGHLKLENLCWIYDDNRITIEGETDLSFSEDVATRFQGLGWNTVTVEDANDLDAIRQALAAFQQTSDKPTLVILRSVIGYGSPNKSDSHAAHGAPLGEEEVVLTKQAYGWKAEEPFHVPAEVLQHMQDGIGARGAAEQRQWQQDLDRYAGEFPSEAEQLGCIWRGELPGDWEDGIPVFPADEKGPATRVSSGIVLNGLSVKLPWLLGGSADLAPSTMTLLDDEDAGDFSSGNYAGRNLHFGIREHVMAAISNGMALSGLRPYCATFFVFADYLRPSLRLSSIMHLPVIYVMTHDSIGLGEDGPTHQPVAQLAACRAIPNLLVMRPADAGEVAECYRTALKTPDRPSMFVLTRQGLPTLCREKYAEPAVERGAYILADSDGEPEVLLLGTGSEIGVCLAAHDQLSAEGIASRVVSMPCWELFDQQDQQYRDQVLPPGVVARVAVEAGIRQGWDAYLGVSGRFVGMSGFGASAPASVLYEHFGITAENVAGQARELVVR
ncbi:MAG: transketolase [Pirellulaceae bacterium]